MQCFLLLSLVFDIVTPTRRLGFVLFPGLLRENVAWLIGLMNVRVSWYLPVSEILCTCAIGWFVMPYH